MSDTIMYHRGTAYVAIGNRLLEIGPAETARYLHTEDLLDMICLALAREEFKKLKVKDKLLQ